MYRSAVGFHAFRSVALFAFLYRGLGWALFFMRQIMQPKNSTSFVGELGIVNGDHWEYERHNSSMTQARFMTHHSCKIAIRDRESIALFVQQRGWRRLGGRGLRRCGWQAAPGCGARRITREKRGPCSRNNRRKKNEKTGEGFVLEHAWIYVRSRVKRSARRSKGCVVVSASIRGCPEEENKEESHAFQTTKIIVVEEWTSHTALCHRRHKTARGRLFVSPGLDICPSAPTGSSP